MSYKSPLINVIKIGMSKISRRLTRDFGEIENLQLSHDKIDNFTQKSIIYVQKTLKDYLKNSRPKWFFFNHFNNENIEGKKINLDDDNYFWVIEPISGLNNFKRGIPFFAVSIAVKRNEETIVSCIFDPIRDEFFFAQKGGGAFLNDRRIRISNRTDLKQTLISVQTNFSETLFKNFLNSKKIKMSNIRFLFCSALSFAWLSSGKFDCFLGENLNYNICESGYLILRESGGFYSEILSKGYISLIAANPSIHKDISKLIKQEIKLI